MWEENVLQPLLVTESILSLATETVCMILKIDGMSMIVWLAALLPYLTLRSHGRADILAAR